MPDGYVAEYLRISDDDNDIGEMKQESGSISNQRKVLQYFISHNEELSKYPIKEFLDDGFSGVNFNRPGIQALLKEVREGKICCIVVKDLSRLGRNYIEVGDYIEQIFPFMGVRFISVSDNYDSFQSQGGVEIGFRNLIHDLYSRDLSKKIKSVKRMQQQRGVYCGGDVPYGYKREEGETGVYQPDSEAAKIVQRIFSLALEGREPSSIAEYLNKEGIPTPGEYKNRTKQQNYRLKNSKSNFWTSMQVRSVIQNEAYIGTYVCHRNSSVRPRTMKRNEPEDYIKHENNHEGLISKSDFEAAQYSIQIRGKRGKYKKDSNPHMLKGKVKCGYCGYSMNRNRKTKNCIYYCRMGASCGSHLRIETDILEKAVSLTLKKLIEIYQRTDKKHETKRIRGMNELKKEKEEKRIIEMKMEHCRINRLSFYHQWKEQIISKEEYVVRRDTAVKQETEYRKILESIENRIQKLTTEWKENTGEGILKLYNGFQELTKELVDKLIERIDVYEESRVEIYLKVQSGFDIE